MHPQITCPSSDSAWCLDGTCAQEKQCRSQAQSLAVGAESKSPFLPYVAEAFPDLGICHVLKIEKEYFSAIAAGLKTFEIRRNDRNFQAGHRVILSEVDPSLDTWQDKTTGRLYQATIGHVSNYGQVPGTVVFSLLKGRLIGAPA